MPRNKVLVIGVTGQDGCYLSSLLLSKGYSVYGSSRDIESADKSKLARLGVKDKVSYLSIIPQDYRSVLRGIEQAEPDVIYYLASQSSVEFSFEQPAEVMYSSLNGILNVLEACRHFDKRIRIYHASSSEIFGDTNGIPALEETKFNPRSPYGVAKASATMLVKNYREAYGMFACSGVMFNHESPLRHSRFVTQKICSAVREISLGNEQKIELNNISVTRDWGWAPEYVDAMIRMMVCDSPRDLVIATGKPMPLVAFIEAAFQARNLDWREYVTVKAKNSRPIDIEVSMGDPSRAAMEIGWTAQTTGHQVAEKMVNDVLF
ncbi:MAG: GDP-mannose 4,6-dehydratase [Leptolyngbyaceae bacterium]|nr:GDP-mannose 4,6-dehydratase [Leptolyngbyaceae bacterium]